jgi:hypothetical protein
VDSFRSVVADPPVEQPELAELDAALDRGDDGFEENSSQ